MEVGTNMRTTRLELSGEKWRETSAARRRRWQSICCDLNFALLCLVAFCYRRIDGRVDVEPETELQVTRHRVRKRISGGWGNKNA